MGLLPESLGAADLLGSLPPPNTGLCCLCLSLTLHGDTYRVRVLAWQSRVATDAGELGPLYPLQERVICRVNGYLDSELGI